MSAVSAFVMLVSAAVPAEAPATPDGPELIARIDAALAKVRARPLSPQIHTPWAVMHAVIAFGRDARITVDGRPTDAVGWLLHRAEFDGRRIFRPAPGGLESWSPGRHFAVQDHPDQYLSVLARAGVRPDDPVTVGDRTYTVADLIGAARLAVREGREASFTLTAFLILTDPDARWRNAEGEEFDIARLAAMETAADVDSAACGGTHRLWALAHACAARRAAGRPMEGVWAEAEAKVRRHTAIALAWQGPEGYFSAGFSAKAARPRTDAHLLYATGHTLEFLAVACRDDQIRSEPLRRAAALTAAKLLEHADDPAVPDGTRYHAAAALRAYRARLAPR